MNQVSSDVLFNNVLTNCVKPLDEDYVQQFANSLPRVGDISVLSASRQLTLILYNISSCTPIANLDNCRVKRHQRQFGRKLFV